MDQIDRLINREGGSKVVNLHGDTGGVTKYGISSNNHPNVNVPKLSYQEAREIYRNEYLEGPNIHLLPQPLQEQVFDFAVHSGPNTAIKKLQMILNLPETGKVGPELLEELEQWDPMVVNNALLKVRVFFLLNINKPQFWRGWIRRAMGFMV